jgi:hypothetical protein
MPARCRGSAEPLVLGIDPGMRVCGWGIVSGGSGGCDRGAIKPRVKGHFRAAPARAASGNRQAD